MGKPLKWRIMLSHRSAGENITLEVVGSLDMVNCGNYR